MPTYDSAYTELSAALASSADGETITDAGPPAEERPIVHRPTIGHQTSAAPGAATPDVEAEERPAPAPHGAGHLTRSDLHAAAFACREQASACRMEWPRLYWSRIADRISYYAKTAD